ncbi:hypothetical protein TRFO_20849 [Tritrichomonas foetus]|uniref:HECT-type E3 ubiquitin transferase n=1 Tax=Tritrichomonas foetus TaxID=1144522 RepID=A0A1J4KFN9_9EUKA|nr:hypothetical protein TRFO_20849 [Tritrichomonas foetus]|eukprot:OHT10043.1 hypothetical protein TRFO_20849 [Tritrichomonas foetus]
MERSLLFESSVMFENSTVVDRIRQSLIDISIDPPSEEEVQDLLNEAISYLDKEIPKEAAFDLFSLISACFSHYPSQLSNTFIQFFENCKKNENHIIVTAQVLAELLQHDPVPQLPDYHSFVSESLSQILPQLQNSEASSMKLFGYEIPASCEINLVFNLLLSSKLTDQIVVDFSPFVFTNKLLRTNKLTSILISNIYKNDLFRSLPEELNSNVLFLSLLSNDELLITIKNLKDEFFTNNLKTLEESCIKRKSAELNLELINRCISLNGNLTNIQKILEPLKANDLTSEIWAFLKTFDFRLPDHIASEIKEFPDPTFALKIMPKASQIPEAILSQALMETSDFHVYEYVLSNELVNPTLATVEFWIHLISVFPENEQIQRKTFSQFAQCFQANIRDNISDILDSIILADFPPKQQALLFLSRLMTSFSGDYFSSYASEENTKKILSHLTTAPLPLFWSIIYNQKAVYDLLMEKKSPLLMLGYAAICKSMRKRPQITEVDILPQTDESFHQIFEYISKERNSGDSSFFDVDKMDDPALSFIACALVFSTAELAHRQRNEEPAIKVNGLTKENLLPFICIICEFVNNNDSAYTLKAIISLFKQDGIFELKNKSFEYSANNNSPIITVSLNNLVLFLRKFSISRAGCKLQANILNQLIPLLLRDEYPADKKSLIRLIHQVSVEPSDSIDFHEMRRQLAHRTQISEDIIGLFTKYQEELFAYLFSNAELVMEACEKTPLNLSLFNKEKIQKTVLEAIQVADPAKVTNTIRFLEQCCRAFPKLDKIENTEPLINALKLSIENEKWTECSSICKFMQENSLNKELLEFIDQPIQDSIKISVLKKIPVEEISFDILLPLLINVPHPEESNILLDILTKKVMDEDTKTNHILFLLEKIPDKFSFTADLMMHMFYHEFVIYGDTMINALHKVYVMPPGTTTFILKANPDPMAPLSDYSLSIVNKLLDIAAENSSYQAFVWLKCLANGFPFLFNQNPQRIFDVVLATFDSLGSVLTASNDFVPTTSYSVFAALSFITFALFSPIILDAFATFFFDNFSTFSDNQLLGLLLILRSLYCTKSIQHVLTALMMKYNWPELITEVLERERESNLVKENLFMNIFSITSMFYRSLNQFTQSMAVTADELQNIENPFQVTFDNTITILPTVTRKMPFSFLLLPNHVASACEKFLDRIAYDKYRNMPHRQPQGRLDKLHDFAKNSQKPYDGPLPAGTDREAFQLLPLKLQSTILHHHLPQVPQLTSAMERVLVSQPTWVCNWLKRPSSLLVLPEHYAILTQVLTDLNQLNGVEDELQSDDATLLLFCQPTLYEDLTRIIENSKKEEYMPSLFTVFSELSKNGTAMLSLLEYISQHLLAANQASLRHLLKVLLVMSKSQDFKANFPDICAPSVLDVVCAPENRIQSSFLVAAANLFSQLGDEIPNRVVHLIGFMFLCGNQKIIPSALDLCAKLNDQKRENVMIYVQNAFDRAIVNYKPGQSSSEISEFLKRFPIVATARQPQMLNLLQQLLSNYHKCSLGLIGHLFNVLAPHRNRSQSIRLSDSITFDPHHPRPKSMTIPPSILQQAPEFWKVFEEHRKMINNIIQRDPHRLKHEFKFLLEYPELTDFSVRVAFFHDSMSEIISSGNLDLVIRRQNILTDSFLRLHNCKPRDLLKNIHVKFIGEAGYDAGGLRRDWFTQLVKEMFNPNYALFIPSANKRSNQPNPSSYVNNDHIEYFRFAGLIIARALIDGVNLDAHLTTSFCKHILQTPVSLRDVEDVDESLHQSLQWMLQNDVEPLEMYFTADVDDLGQHKTIDLKPNGSNIKLTNENKDEFVSLMVDHRLKGAISSQVRAFCEGFNTLIPPEEIRRFSPNELDLLICGIPEIDVADLQKYTELQRPYTADHPVIKFFFDAISKWDNENLAKLLLFITGSSQVPINGFKAFKDMNQPITIAPGGGKERLPAAHTCFNTLDLPEYDSEADLNQKLMFAIQECNSFGFI